MKIAESFQTRLFEMASLAAGGALLAADLALQGEPTFACVRPPGHHASRNSAWGHCTFSNVALALLRLRQAGRIRSAFVVDFDQHTGDGTLDVLRGWPEAQVFNAYGNNAAEYLYILEERLKQAPQVDILAVSAGFDSYIHDLGRKLSKYPTLLDLLRAQATAEASAAAKGQADYQIKDVEMLPPIPTPDKNICVGINYPDRNAEYKDGREAPKYPNLFCRFPTSIVGTEQPIVRPKVSDKFDYEGEVVLVMGKEGRHIPRESALSFVAGVTLGNEGSVKSVLKENRQVEAPCPQFSGEP